LSVTPTPPEPPADPVLSALLDVTGAEVETEFKISERYEAKSGIFFGIAVAFFGATQAFVLQHNFHKLSSPHRHLLQVFVVVAAITFGCAILAAMFSALQRSDKNLDAGDLFAMARDKTTTLQDIVSRSIALLSERRSANKKRLTGVRMTQVATLITVLAAAVEFTVALIYFI
jgi:hypothetical protein